MKNVIAINDLDQLAAFARDYAAALTPGAESGTVIGLVGDLGAGKTTFVQLLAKAIGVREAVKSPTFILMQVLEAGAVAQKRGLKRLCHVDAYRLKDYSELRAIGFEEYAVEPGTVCLVEWADRVPELHGLANYEEITFTIGEKGRRRLRIGK